MQHEQLKTVAKALQNKFYDWHYSGFSVCTGGSLIEYEYSLDAAQKVYALIFFYQPIGESTV